ncbi:PREDICTED: tetraspanin-20-like [Nicotiana attenuata]|uniref:Tetraspanin-20 n=1 Tax=Nicotiana attenuata TaxID=49451 RepID=A0A314LG63_NICAT|nr:PREDICTED: tetraspanin-20-like [Nicotiana attenuata]OIT40658.1 tetraspanin-20 [Nicotiana attenuata]
MGTPCCQGFIAFLLKFLNFLQTFIGVSIIIYSAYMLNHWQHHNNFLPPNPDSEFSNFGLIMLNKHSLTAPWFIYAFMGIGVILCCITCIGHVGAEAVNGCFLCFYSLLMTAFVLVEIGLVVFIALDRQWEKDLPRDPTGELHSLRTFIVQNMDVCKWIGIAVIIIQASSLLLAIVLRALVSDHRISHDMEGDYDVIGRTREPLLDPRLSQTSGLAKADAKVGHSDIWSSRMREKYHLDGEARHHTPNQNPS